MQVFMTKIIILVEWWYFIFNSNESYPQLIWVIIEKNTTSTTTIAAVTIITTTSLLNPTITITITSYPPCTIRNESPIKKERKKPGSLSIILRLANGKNKLTLTFYRSTSMENRFTCYFQTTIFSCFWQFYIVVVTLIYWYVPFFIV